MNKVICNFSCGAASAVATKLALRKYPNAIIVYMDTGAEHPDNARFLKECEKWFGKRINVLRSIVYSNPLEVFRARKFMVSVSSGGAPCTGELKRIPYEKVWMPGDIDILGYTAEEAKRVDRFKRDNPEKRLETPLIDAFMTKSDCMGFLSSAGIEIPEMYKLGFSNNNCIGCVKARDSKNYWKRVRKHFPEQFKQIAELETQLGFALNRFSKNGKRESVFLRDLEVGDPTDGDGVSITCSLFCHSETIEQ